ncbi:MAG: hypothetical protein WAL52_09420 [Candidatus Sulfotelmatobacter sp.]
MLRSLLATLLLVATSVTAGDAWTIREDGVGPVKVGMTLAQLSAALHQKLAADEQDEQGCFYINPRGHDNISFMIIDGHVARVEVGAAGIKTTTGIQVGDSEAQVRKAYGARMKVTAHQYIDTGHYLTVRSADGRYGIRFETDKGKITTFYAGKYDAIQYVEGCE